MASILLSYHEVVYRRGSLPRAQASCWGSTRSAISCFDTRASSLASATWASLAPARRAWRCSSRRISRCRPPGCAFASIPLRRIVEGSRIWPECRWHALVFCVRSLALRGLAATSPSAPDPRDAPSGGEGQRQRATAPPRRAAAAAAIVLATMAAANAVTRSFARRGLSSRTIRDLKAPRGAQYLMSVPQFYATLNRWQLTPAKCDSQAPRDDGRA